MDKGPADVYSVTVSGNRPVTNLYAISKVPADLFFIKQAVTCMLAFRIAAPQAPEGTTLIENDRPDTAAIMGRKPLDVEDHRE